jgi:hypothetical protein
MKSKKVNEAIREVDLGGPYGCEVFRIPHFLYTRVSDGVEVSRTHRPRFAPINMSFISFFWYSFYVEQTNSLAFSP